MSIIDRLFRRETRAETIAPSDPYLAQFFGQRDGLGGYVDAERASGLATANACIGLISQLLSSMPLTLYRRTENRGREKAVDHPLYGVLHDLPNATQTAMEARELMLCALLIGGNAYALIERNGRGQVTALTPLDPGAVAVERLRSGRLRYRVSDPSGGVSVRLKEDVLHLRHRLARDGVMGLSPLQIARETFNLSLSQQDTAGKQAAKGFRPEGAIVFPETITGDQRTRLLSKLGEKIDANNATAGIMVLDGGTQWQPFAFSSKDSEFLESRKLTELQIARVYQVPPTAIGITDHATYSNVGEESRALVVKCLAPMARRIEQAMSAALLTPESRRTLFVEHELAGLLRGDMAARYGAYAIGRQWGSWYFPQVAQ